MTHSIAATIVAVAIGASPISASTAQAAATSTAQAGATSTAQVATSPLSAQLATRNARFTLLDQDGNVVGILVASDTDRSTLRLIGRSSAATDVPAPRAFRVDVSNALTPRQMEDIDRAALDAFFHIDHTS